MDGLILLTRDQVEEYERNHPPRAEDDVDERKKHKKSSKSKKHKKDKKRRRSSSASSASDDEDRKRRKKHKKSKKKDKKAKKHKENSSSSSASSSSSDDEDNVGKQRKAEDQLKSYEQTRSARQAAGLGWMTSNARPALPSSSSSAPPTIQEAPVQAPSNQQPAASAAPPSKYDPTRDPLSRQHPNFPKHLNIALGDHSYLTIPTSSGQGYPPDSLPCWIVPLEYFPSSRDCTAAACLNEVERFKASLVEMYSSRGLITVFMETCSSSSKSRFKIECLGLDSEYGDTLPIIFNKEISESDQEWTENPKLIDLKSKSLRQGLPPNTPYFFVEIYDVSASPKRQPIIRYAHIIESSTHFPWTFGMDVIRGAVGQDRSGKKRTERSKRDEDDLQRRDQFLAAYKRFDWTSELDGGEHLTAD